MGILLAARAVRQTIVILQVYLPTYLTTLAAEFTDGVILPAVDRWHDYERDVPLADNVGVEVWASAMEVIDAEIGLPAADRQITSRTEVHIRVTQVNRAQQTTSQMGERTRRYAVAISRVLSDYAQLSNEDVAAVVLDQSFDFSTAMFDEGDARRSADMVEIRFSLQMTEGSASVGLSDFAASVS